MTRDIRHRPRCRHSITIAVVVASARRFGTTSVTNKVVFGRMSTPTSGIDADNQRRLDIARRLYKALVAQNPDRLVTLCDGSGRVLARSERRPKEDAAEETL